jgi:hypothetical protein
LRNEATGANHWLGVRLQGVQANRDAIGARLKWGSRQRLKNGGGSYLSAHDPRDILGLGASSAPVSVDVEWPWPSRRKERFANLAPGKYHVLREGQGTPLP